MQRIRLATALALILLTGSAAAGVYRWVDAEGNVHYGDRPPADHESSSVTVSPDPGTDPDHKARAEKQRRLLEAIEAERAEREQQDADAARAGRERDTRCQQARGTLADLERANLVYTTDESGTRTYMDDEERRPGHRAGEGLDRQALRLRGAAPGRPTGARPCDTGPAFARRCRGIS